MPTNIDDKELSRLEKLASAGYGGPFIDLTSLNNSEMRGAITALVADVRRLRKKVEAWEWLFDVIEYDVYEDHPLSSRWGHDMSDKERETYVNARISYAHIEDAAREAVHADRE